MKVSQERNLCLGIKKICVIVGAVAQRDIAEILLEGLRRLEYRGYDSAGMAVVDTKVICNAYVKSAKCKC